MSIRFSILIINSLVEHVKSELVYTTAKARDLIRGSEYTQVNKRKLPLVEFKYTTSGSRSKTMNTSTTPSEKGNQAKLRTTRTTVRKASASTSAPKLKIRTRRQATTCTCGHTSSQANRNVATGATPPPRRPSRPTKRSPGMAELVRASLALLITLLFGVIALAAIFYPTASEVFKTFMQVVTPVLGFYFGHRLAERSSHS